jgi:hypothetical protein
MTSQCPPSSSQPSTDPPAANIPAEMWHTVMERMELKDVQNLSSVNQYLRTLCLPEVFRNAVIEVPSNNPDNIRTTLTTLDAFRKTITRFEQSSDLTNTRLPDPRNVVEEARTDGGDYDFPALYLMGSSCDSWDEPSEDFEPDLDQPESSQTSDHPSSQVSERPQLAESSQSFRDLEDYDSSVQVSHHSHESEVDCSSSQDSETWNYTDSQDSEMSDHAESQDSQMTYDDDTQDSQMTYDDDDTTSQTSHSSEHTISHPLESPESLESLDLDSLESLELDFPESSQESVGTATFNAIISGSQTAPNVQEFHDSGFLGSQETDGMLAHIHQDSKKATMQDYEMLGLCGNLIRTFANSFRSFPSLSRVHISSMPVTNTLYQALVGLQRLQQLTFQDCEFLIQENTPNLAVTNAPETLQAGQDTLASLPPVRPTTLSVIGDKAVKRVRLGSTRKENNVSLNFQLCDPEYLQTLFLASVSFSNRFFHETFTIDHEFKKVTSVYVASECADTVDFIELLIRCPNVEAVAFREQDIRHPAMRLTEQVGILKKLATYVGPSTLLCHLSAKPLRKVIFTDLIDQEYLEDVLEGKYFRNLESVSLTFMLLKALPSWSLESAFPDLETLHIHLGSPMDFEQSDDIDLDDLRGSFERIAEIYFYEEKEFAYPEADPGNLLGPIKVSSAPLVRILILTSIQRILAENSVSKYTLYRLPEALVRYVLPSHCI